MKKLSVLLSILIIISCCFFVSCKDEHGNETSITGHTVSFNSNGGSYIRSVKVTTLINPETPTRSYHLFDGWYLDQYLNNLATFPLTVNYDQTLYAKWIPLTKSVRCEDASIKMWFEDAPGAMYDIDLSAIDLHKLAQKGYRVRFTVDYYVSYTKDYVLPIGYAGPPKYEVSIIASDLTAMMDKDLPTTTTPTSQRNIFITSINSILDKDIDLSFSTDNIQNTIHFQNIYLEVECFK